MANYWEEGLDLDDSDLHTNNFLPSINVPSSVSNPSLKPCSSKPPSFVQNPSSVPSPRVVPGPAGTLQMAMNRTRKRDLDQLGSEEELVEAEIDGDFLLDSWVHALRFVGKEMESVTHIASISTRTIRRIPLVVGLVKTCTPNGLGDLFLTLKDQTGTIGASIHRKILLEKNLASDITVGSVLILKEVVVFSPTRCVQYLNITLGNLVKIIGKNFGPPEKDWLASFAQKIDNSGNQIGINKVLPPQMENIPNRRAQNETASMKEFTNKTLDFSKILSNINSNKNTNTIIPSNNLPKCHQTDTTGGSSVILNKISGESFQSQISKNENLKENLKPTQENNIKKEKVVASNTSVLEWTDDQLSELFADY
ncbi:hypothetical protein LUZ60_013707 [Juncus effusus]|nr:hypothetical protein LUZ60_013707 [Juncus effusus]